MIPHHSGRGYGRQILHGSAKTTHAVRAAIQRSKATIAELAEKYDLNPKTVMKWRRRQSVEDMPMGPRDARSTVLSVEEEALCIAFRKHTLLPLDDCLYALQASIPHLTRSSLHRLFQRHDISRLPSIGGEKTRKKFKSYPIGYFTTPGNVASAAKIIREALDRGELVWAHGFELTCAQNDIDHRLTKPNHPWTNGQVERMNRTLKEATVRRYYYDSHQQLRAHLAAFVDAYNFAKRLKTLNGLTPYEHICKCWTEQPNRFNVDPTHLSPGPNS